MSVPDIAAIERALDSEETTGWRTNRSQLVDDLRALIARVRELERAGGRCECCAPKAFCDVCARSFDQEAQT